MYVVFAIVVVVVVGYSFVKGRQEQRQRLQKKIRDSWGNASNREFSYDEFESVSHYFQAHKHESDFYLDDITWNDLGMDDLFLLINQTMSSVGEEYLYYLLRTPVREQSMLDERKRLSDFFTEHKQVREKVQTILAQIGYTRHFSLVDYLQNMKELKQHSSLHHYLGWCLYAISVVLFFLQPGVGILAFLVSLVINIVYYFKEKAMVENYFVCIGAVTRLSSVSQKMAKLEIPELQIYLDELGNIAKEMQSVAKDARWIGNGGVQLNFQLSDVCMEYIRMLTHIDLIKFNHVVSKVKDKQEQVERMYQILGLFEGMIAAASFQKMMPYTCTPVFRAQKQVDYQEVYHPMVKNPVANSIHETHPVLLTGSNASGKSTFLKTVAINAILAQEFNFALAKRYEGSFYRIYSSMALKDNLLGSESYYIVEIKSLKRILDAAKQQDGFVLCFVDEVLRGTNTVERVAASSKILQCLAQEGVMCFAATHDIELTQLLEEDYSNYHFREEVGENDVIFNYRLYTGRATTRNAIRLLEKMGYDAHITQEADATARHFLETGEWKLI